LILGDREELSMTARLQEFYKEKVVPELIKQFGYKSVM
jgi:large subunit ribosomal protein L5